jgi:hypothetical protein
MHPQGTQFFDESLQQSFNRGRAEGKIAALLTLLEARGLLLDDQQRARIESCTEPDTLDRWIRRSATVAMTDELFT